MNLDLAERSNYLTEYDYKFLKGDKIFWPGWGAAFGVVADYCRNKGYGDFGEPTERGKREMDKYEFLTGQS